jgi:predicted GNAT family acetyltransferase
MSVSRVEECELRFLQMGDARAAVERLARDARANLFLLDLAAQLEGESASGDPRPQLLGSFRGRRLEGVAALRPTVVFEAASPPAFCEALAPWVAALGAALVKSDEVGVSRLASLLVEEGRTLIVDRIETAYALEPRDAVVVPAPRSSRVRRAERADLPWLVEAARASLIEERRPDPYDGDVAGFRRWVRGRLDRALVVEEGGEPRFVGYGDVRRAEGWLVQGVYTRPEWRRRGLAAAGVSALCRDAFAAGATHVQLSVVDGNGPAVALYRDLGFRSFARLRTLLFA